MTESRSLEELFNEVVASHSFDKLDEFIKLRSMSTLTQNERSLVAKLLILQAHAQLKKNQTSQEILETAKMAFQKAVELAPLDPEIWQQKGIACAACESPELLLEAQNSFETATQLNPWFFEAWYAWAAVLTRVGVLYDDIEFFFDANDKYKVAQGCIDAKSIRSDEDKLEFYWHWGLLHCLIARTSGEPQDFQRAVMHFRKAKEYNLKLNQVSHHFYSDFALVLIELATLICREDLVFEAIELFSHCLPENLLSIKDDEKNEYALSYFNSASCYHYLFGIRLEKRYLLLAHEQFEKAASLGLCSFDLYLQWANLHFLAAKLWQDATYLRTSVEKFDKANNLSERNPLVLGRFAEALALLGSHEESVEFIAEAKKLIQSAESFGEETAELFSSSVFVLCQYGRYFVEEKYFLEAIEKADQGLLQFEKYGPLWHGLGVAKFSLGEIREDHALLQEANSAFLEASKLESGRFAYFWNEWGILLLSLAEATCEKKHLEDAERKFERTIILHETVEPEWLFNYGCTLDFLGDLSDDEAYYERAVQALTAALTAAPSYQGVRTHLAAAYAHLGEIMSDVEAFRKSMLHFQVAILEDPEDDLAWCEWGVALMHFYDLTEDEIAGSGLQTSLLDMPQMESVAQIGHEQLALPLEHAEHNFLQAILLGNTQANYNLACLYSVQGNISDAMLYFEKAVDCADLPPFEVVMQDLWLQNLRNTPSFQNFVQKLAKEAEEFDES